MNAKSLRELRFTREPIARTVDPVGDHLSDALAGNLIERGSVRSFRHAAQRRSRPYHSVASWSMRGKSVGRRGFGAMQGIATLVRVT
jgi:hypothetical protein